MFNIVKPAYIVPEHHQYRKKLMIDLPIQERGANSGTNSTRNITKRPNTASLIGSPVFEKKKWGQCVTMTDNSGRALRITPIGLTYNFFTFQYIFFVNGLTNSRRLWDDGTFSAFGISSTGVLNPFFVWTSNDSSGMSTAAGTVAAGNYYNMFVTYDCTNRLNIPAMVLNGVPIPAASFTQASSGAPKNFTALTIGGSSTPGSFDGSIFAWRMWNRILPMAEMLQLTYDPWCIYRRSTRKTESGIYLPN